MIINIMVDTAEGTRTGGKVKMYDWPVVPRIGETVDISEDGSGHDCIVTAIDHRLGIGQTDICVETDQQGLDDLTEADGWK